MNVQWFIYEAAGKPLEHILEPYDGYCAVCGEKISEGVPTKKVLSNSFTNRDMIKGSHVCMACAHLLKGELATKLRRSSFVVSRKKIKFFKNKELAKILFNPPEPPFVICYTTSFKKHNAFRAVLNTSKEHFFVRWEDRLVEFNRKKAESIFRSLVIMFYNGFSKDELRNFSFSASKVSKLGFTQFLKHFHILEQHYGMLLYEFLIEALPIDERNNYQKAVKRRDKDGTGFKRARTKGLKGALHNVEKLRLFQYVSRPVDGNMG